MAADVPNGWISDACFRADLARLGSRVSDAQLERWRGEGLLPSPVQRARYGEDGRVSGSRTWHPPNAAQQVVATERALHANKRIAHAGSVLWAAGFSVADGYWRDGLDRSGETLRRLGLGLWVHLRRHEDEETLGEQVAALGRLSGVAAKMGRRVGRDGLARVINVGVDVAASHFSHFDHQASDREESMELLAQRAFDFEAGAADHIWGQTLNLAAGLEQALSAISRTGSTWRVRDFSQAEIEAARDDVRHGLKIMFCLHEALSWIYGRQAFGLAMGAYMARTLARPAIFTFTLGFARLRRSSDSLMTSSEIGDLADSAEKIWLISEYFRKLQSESAEFRNLVGSKPLKNAFRDSRKHRILLDQLGKCEFPIPEFRPWDQWKSSAKMMSPGLLAMSIGAPEQVTLEDVLRSANKTPSR